MKLTKRQIEAIKILTNYEYEKIVGMNTFIKSSLDGTKDVALEINGTGISYYRCNVEFYDGAKVFVEMKSSNNEKVFLPNEWLLPLHQIINENKTKPLYEFDCDSCNSNWKSDFDGEFHNGDCEYDGDRSEYYNGEVIFKKIISFEKGVRWKIKK